MDWSLLLSVLALIASVFTYFKHDKKLKEQERKINEYQLKQIEKEDLESKKAAIRGNIVKGLKGGRTLKVYNSGCAIARNIRVEGLDVWLIPYSPGGSLTHREIYRHLYE